MTKLAIIDLDGVVADNTKRFEKAEEAKQAFLQEKRNNPAVVEGFNVQKEATNLFWQEAFNPELVSLDTLIEGVPEALDTLYGEYGVIFLTSRPESMRGATEAWLEEHDISVEHPQFGDFLVMKQPAFQFVKTVTWKAGMVQMLHKLFDADTVVFIDDEQANRQIVMDGYLDGSINLIVASNLAEALEKLKEE